MLENKKTYENKLMIYVPVDKRELLKQLKKILKTEGKSVSELFWSIAQEYYEQHKRGNPQLLITHYVKPEEPQPMRVLCIYCQGALTDGRIFCQRKGMWIPGVSCYSCKFNRLRKQK